MTKFWKIVELINEVLKALYHVFRGKGKGNGNGNGNVAIV